MRTANFWSFAGVAALALLSCNKTGGLQSVAPSLQITPDALHFPLTAFGETAAQTLQLSSESAADVQVTLQLTGASAAAYTLEPSGSINVPANQGLSVQLTFAPQLPSPIPSSVQSLNATLTVTSDDPQHPSTAVPVTGSAQAPQLDLCWNQPPAQCLSSGALTIELGSLPPEAADAGLAEIQLKDLAEVPLTVTQLELDPAAQDAGYVIEESVVLPIVLSAQAGLADVFHVRLVPLRPGPAQGKLIVQSDDPRSDGGPVEASLDATIQPFQPPVACLGITEIDYLNGQIATVNPAESLASQPAIIPPGPLDTVVLTAEVSPTCSSDPQNGQDLNYQFGLATPEGSTAALTSVTGHPEEQRVQFDLAGSYDANVKATDSAGLSATASLEIGVAPQDDLEATLTWSGLDQADLDLHLIRQLGGGNIGSLIDDPLNDCFWCNCLLPINYSGGSPCSVPQGVQYPTSLQWGQVVAAPAGNPLLVASNRFDPLPSRNLDDVRLTGPQAGATYGIYAHYYQAYQAGPDGGCATDEDCTDPVYASCWGNECVPQTAATLQIYISGQSLTGDGGLQLAGTLRRPCDLWFAGALEWVSGGHFSDGGYAPPVFNFTPGDGGISNNSPGLPGLICGEK
jgi:hypothetical protein